MIAEWRKRETKRIRSENEICLLILDRKCASVCDKKTNFHQKLPEISQFYRKRLPFGFDVVEGGVGMKVIKVRSASLNSGLQSSLDRVFFIKRKFKLASFKEGRGVSRLNPSQTRVINVSLSIGSRNVDICQCRHKTFNQPFECRGA